MNRSELTIPQGQFASVRRKAVRECRDAKLEKIALEFYSGALWLALPGARFSVPATGTWDSAVSISVVDLRAMAKPGRTRVPLKLALEGDELQVEGEGLDLRFACASVEPRVETNPRPLRSRYRMVFADTKLGSPDAARPETIDDRRETAIYKALELLRPFGVTLRGLRGLVEKDRGD